MHPRKALRDEIRALLEAALPGVPVHVSASRQVRIGADGAVMLYVMKEVITRPGAARGRGVGPFKRSAEIDVVVVREGQEGDVVDRGDAMSRAVELALASRPGLELLATATEIDGGAQTVRCASVMSYAAEIIDTLTPGGSA